ncbi:carboxypeptidase M32 [Limnoglobus roseus]|uniref:Metal-dependent carboxypeptidase n=1 Tax=Limnoglobus roseus TaxID=2598579 RepID=A0A5C1AFJ8_9BACT|nr:carboxypeptidase M32 [Limnoglobus roseus]QEL18199.1 carboxypeptidase M32 [Limnoglobus roseus]
MNTLSPYADLMYRSRQVALLGSCSSVLGWDQQTYMPKGGAAFRGEQLALLATLAHKQATDARVGELLGQVEAEPRPADSVEASNVRELRHAYDRAVKIPPRLVEELARVTAQANEAWIEARAKSDFSRFAPFLEQIVALKREEAAFVGWQEHPYDALLDEYEPGAKSSQIRSLFAELSAGLVPIIRQIRGATKTPDATILQRDFPTDRQHLFAESAAAAIGFDFHTGRLDTTTHPFCSGFGPGDCRITTRYNPKAFNEAFFGVLHEAGHGLYEQNLPANRYGEPTAQACSLGIHESQSRLWENLVGRSRPFWDHFFPRLQQTFPSVRDVSADAFHFTINEVRPSFIRVEADEATYNLHIILRFEIELALMSGDLLVADLPAAWNEKFRAMFDLTPPSDREGCLQDIHWSFGGIGYFPTYTLGNLFAAQFMHAARNQLPDVDAAMRQGDFRGLREWLIANIHHHGRHYRAGALCERVTGTPLRVQPFLDQLKAKFFPLYEVS